MKQFNLLTMIVAIAVIVLVAVTFSLTFPAFDDTTDDPQVKAWAEQEYGDDVAFYVTKDNPGIVLENGTWVEYPGDGNVELKVSGEVMG